MLTDTEKQNESVTPNIKEIEILKKYFPQCFDKPERDENGNIIKEHFDIEKLSDILNRDEIEIKKEGFTLNFLGKSYARYQSNLDSETVIVPDKENDKKDSENVYIVGDNLDALQHLKYSYAEKIKCIYIDPPYNTGKEDFVYNDKFGFTTKELIEKLDISEEEAERIVGMEGKCTHSAWLTFMYPRLVLARELLRDDGVIFISIDDNEQANLKRLCDEVFGEGNFVSQLIWQNKKGGGNDSTYIAIEHEYILIYAKNKNSLEDFYQLYTEEYLARYKEKDEIGKFFWDTFKRKSGKQYYKIECPDGTFLEKDDDGNPISWLRSEKKFLKDKEQGEVRIIKVKDRWSVQFKQRLPKGKTPRSIFKTNTLIDNKGTTSVGANDVYRLFKKDVFSNPKPVELLEYLLGFTLQDGDIGLDFFSGSGTFAEAVLKANCDGANRNFMLVQNNENYDTLLDKGSPYNKIIAKNAIEILDEIKQPHTIWALACERIRRAAAKLKEEHPDTTVDLGFKTYYLKTMPQNAIDKIKVFDPNALISSDSDIIKTLGVSSLLQTWQIKDGFGFNLKPQTIDLQKYTAYLLDDEKIGKYLYLLTEMNDSQIKELIRKIESMELTIDKVFIYGYSFDFNSLTSIKTNLKTLKNRNPIEPVVRY